MADQLAHFSLLTWLPDPARGERRNIAVLLATEDGRIGKFKAVAPSAINERLRDQGILTQVLQGLESQFAAEVKPTVDDLRQMRNRLVHSLQVTEPQPTALVHGADATLTALFKAYVAIRGGGSQGLSKGSLMSKAVEAFSKKGFSAHRSHYVGDFVFDVVIEAPKRPHAFEVLSFDSPKKEWRDAEHEVGHFLYGVNRVDVVPQAIVSPPTALSNAVARRAHERVIRWLMTERVPVVDPTALRDPGRLLAA